MEEITDKITEKFTFSRDKKLEDLKHPVQDCIHRVAGPLISLVIISFVMQLS